MNDPTRPPSLTSQLKGLAAALLDPACLDPDDFGRRRVELGRTYPDQGIPGWTAILRHYLWANEGREPEEDLRRAREVIPLFWNPSIHPGLAAEADLQIRVALCLASSWSLPDSMVDSLVVLCDHDGARLPDALRIAQALRPDLGIPHELVTGEAPAEITLPLLLIRDSSGDGDPAKLTIRVSPFVGDGVLIPDLAMSLVERSPTWFEMERSLRDYLRFCGIWPESSSQDIEWSITRVGSGVPGGFALSGGSAGAAFAVGISTLVDPKNELRRGFVSRLAISATISSVGGIGRVGGTESKLNSLRNRYLPPIRAAALSSEGFVVKASTSSAEHPDSWHPISPGHGKAVGELSADFVLRNHEESFDLINLGSNFDQLLQRISAYQRSFYWEENPYRGLDHFDLEHASIFFGRESETAKLHERFESREADDEDGCAFVAIIGSSGSGKSSLARAGFAASLVSPPPGSPTDIQWRFVALSPSQMGEDFSLAIIDQMRALNQTGLAQQDRIDLAEELKNQPEQFLAERLPKLAALQKVGSEKRTKLLLLIDQFEELCTISPWCENSQLAGQFLNFLNRLARSGRCRVLVTVRSDYDTALEALPGHSAILGNEAGNHIIRPPQEESLRAIITQPADAAGVIFEEVPGTNGVTLADRLLAAIDQKANALPLLQFTLLELYEKCHNSEEPHATVVMTNAVYDEVIGGVEGSIGRCAEMTYEALKDQMSDESLETTFKTIFSRLITTRNLADGKHGGWAGIPRKEPALIDRNANRDEFMKVLSAFVECRILEVAKSNSDEVTNEYTLRHEAVISSWKRLSKLAAENQRYQNTLKQIQAIVSSWHLREENCFIPKGLILTNAESILAQAPHLLDSFAKCLIRRSTALAKRRKRIQAVLLISLLMSVCLSFLAIAYAAKIQEHAADDARIAADDARILIENKMIALTQIELSDDKQQNKPAQLTSLDPNLNPEAAFDGSRSSAFATSMSEIFSGNDRMELLQSIGLKVPKNPEVIPKLRKYFGDYDNYRAHYLRAILFFMEGAIAYDAKDVRSSISNIELAIKSISIASEKSQTPQELLKASEYRTRIKSRLSDVLMSTNEIESQRRANKILRECIDETLGYSRDPLVNLATIDNRLHYYKLRLAKSNAAIAKHEKRSMDEAILNVEQAIKSKQKSLREYPLETKIQTDRQMAASLISAGEVLRMNIGDLRGALNYFERSRKIRESILEDKDAKIDDIFNAVGSYWYLIAAQPGSDAISGLCRRAILLNEMVLSKAVDDFDNRSRAHANIGSYNIMLANSLMGNRPVDARAINAHHELAKKNLDAAYEEYKKIKPSEYISREISWNYHNLGVSIADFHETSHPDYPVFLGVDCLERSIEMVGEIEHLIPGGKEVLGVRLMDVCASCISLARLFKSGSNTDDASNALKHYQKANALALKYSELIKNNEAWGYATSANILVAMAKLIQSSKADLLGSNENQDDIVECYEQALIQYNRAIEANLIGDRQWIVDSRRGAGYYSFASYLTGKPEMKHRLSKIAEEYFSESGKYFLLQSEPGIKAESFYWWMYSGKLLAESYCGSEGRSREAVQIARLLVEHCRKYNEALHAQSNYMQGYVLALTCLSNVLKEEALADKKTSTEVAEERLTILGQGMALAKKSYDLACEGKASGDLAWHKAALVSINDEWLALASESNLKQDEVKKWSDLKRMLSR